MNSRTPQSWRPAFWTIISAIVIAGIAWSTGIFATLDRAYVDLQSRWLQHEIASDIVIVEIDARSLKELGQWPLPRSHHAALIERLSNAGAQRIFLDIDFSAPSSPSEDARLSAAIAAAETEIFLPAFWQPTSHAASSLVLSEPLPSIRGHAQLALVNLTQGDDGLVREVEDFTNLSTDVLPVWTHFGGRSRSSHALRLDYRIAPSSFERVSYIDVVRGERNLALANKTVFVGATALELGDIVAVPVHRAFQALLFRPSR